MIKALIITGYGINCEREMAMACEMAGATATIAHSQELLSDKLCLEDYHLLMLPGGFSFGDELGAAKAFANRISYATEIKQRLQDFVDAGKCILGVCNGFQLLVKLGFLPGYGSQDLSLASNDSCQFENRWAHHKVFRSPCIFTRDIQHLYLPVRHSEGKLVCKNDAIHRQLIDNNQIAFRYANKDGEPSQKYPDNPNGSLDAIAGLCDPTGRVLGMMAHPEAALRMINHPQWARIKEAAKRKQEPLPWQGEGLKLFENAVNYSKENL
ncbi:MAG: phosphoribosylformylglycinamidine synthase I [Waddliaceae bacterium]